MDQLAFQLLLALMTMAIDTFKKITLRLAAMFAALRIINLA
jgi:hypothetical protein